MTDSNNHAFEWRPFRGGLWFCDFGIEPSQGPLAKLHQPAITRVRGPLLLSLSVSTGAVHGTVDELLSRVTRELLDTVDEVESTALLRALQEKLWRFFQIGRFERAVPEIMVAVAEDGAGLRVWRAGPNGVAVTEGDEVRLWSEDLRFGALRRLGASLDEKWLNDPLLGEVSELTQIEPPASFEQELAVGLENRCLLLLSRGVTPFGAPSDPGSTREWWGRDVGWRHGMGARVVAVAPERSLTLGGRVLSVLAEAIRDARPAGALSV